jgi:hypothetical protein
LSDADETKASPDRDLIESVWEQARDLIKKLEGSTVQRLRVEAGDYKIEIERGAGAPSAPAAGPAQPAPGAGEVAPEAAELDHRIRSLSSRRATWSTRARRWRSSRR